MMTGSLGYSPIYTIKLVFVVVFRQFKLFLLLFGGIQVTPDPRCCLVKGAFVLQDEWPH